MSPPHPPWCGGLISATTRMAASQILNHPLHTNASRPRGERPCVQRPLLGRSPEEERGHGDTGEQSVLKAL